MLLFGSLDFFSCPTLIKATTLIKLLCAVGAFYYQLISRLMVLRWTEIEKKEGKSSNKIVIDYR